MSAKKKGMEIAVRALYAVDIGKNAVPDALLPFKYEPADALEYALQLLEGTLSKINEIDEKISSLLENWKLDRINTVDKEILRIAIFGIDSNFDSEGFIVFVAVELAKKYGNSDSGNFVNGILRNYLRQKYGEVKS